MLFLCPVGIDSSCIQAKDICPQYEFPQVELACQLVEFIFQLREGILEMESNSFVRYRDHVFILIAVPLINLLNYYLTYSSIAFTGYFFLTYTIDTLTGFACWYGGRAAIIYFDKKMRWEANLGKRIAIQLPVVCIVILGIILIGQPPPIAIPHQAGC